MTRKHAQIAAIALATLVLAAAHAATAMELHSDGARAGTYLRLDDSTVISYDPLLHTVTKVQDVVANPPQVMTNSFTCLDPGQGTGCSQLAGDCRWNNQTSTYHEWYDAPFLEGDFQWGRCAVTNVRYEGTHVVTQYRAGLRAAVANPAVNDGYLIGRWQTSADVWWVRSDGSRIWELPLVWSGAAPMCAVNPFGDQSAYVGFHDSVTDVSFASCVWGASDQVDITAKYDAIDSTNAYKSQIVGFVIHAFLDNIDDEDPAWETQDRCKCIRKPSTGGGGGGGGSGGNNMNMA